ncbi:2-hydroxychromene-2-carboxylate isomerase [Pelagibius sp. Alg239-R121]|uniref:2-hydroxychromene-2-carboxylate isomerase n=1 Tax=Pelagibius sp. Alg239-R121 TaxID=2993448 RepID=UPI0024A62226|nr:2-hydroxychromene-2-carboxylate isomerase [Pelagibius sp. Alg239-R121]
MTQPLVPFYFGLGSRYSYLASTQLERIEHQTGCRFEWFSLQSGELIRRANGGHSPFGEAAPSGQYDWDYRQRDAEAWARYYDVPYREPRDFRMDPADLARACWVADRHGQLQSMSRRIFEAVFVENLAVSRDLLTDFAMAIGLDRQDFINALDSSSVITKHEAVLQRAIGNGVFGVPSFLVDGQLLWGNDRLPLLEHALKRLSDSEDTVV